MGLGSLEKQDKKTRRRYSLEVGEGPEGVQVIHTLGGFSPRQETGEQKDNV